ncbi:helix-turn-helix domain-containing protein [Pseudoneobacillus sp. C159]
MNSYLLMLGSSIPEIRLILGLSQDELANMIGISRPTVIKIEQDPSKLTKTFAFALFVVVANELKKRTRKLEEIRINDDMDGAEVVSYVMNEIYKVHHPSWPSTIGDAIGGTAGAIIATMLKSLAKNKSTTYSVSKQKILWDQEMTKKTLDSVKKTFSEEKTRILNFFQITDFNIEQFVKKVEDGEEGK